ncbi:hypothetical protein BKA61DRAFT_622659 [Leptodontidium sp. MPI-SDFR-AT-0119]|nr:hypothetical protein BKA61DRAFT_622659 [Leptodontidium sp. MPI-SDFR-AT-0119]
MTPKELPTRLASREDFNAQAYPMYINEAQTGNSNTLHVTLQSMLYPTAYRYTQANFSIEEIEYDMHDFWFILIQSAKHIDADRPEQDRLARLVLCTRELGPLKRAKKMVVEGKEEEVVEEAMTSDGRMWCDLPFLVTDFKSAWRDATSPSFDSAHRVNLAAFIARLAGLSIGDDNITGCGLDIMKEVLETPRALVRSPLAAGHGNLTINDLLPVVNAWMTYASHKMLDLSTKGFACLSWNTAPGEMATDAGINYSGFSRERFLFWRKRLEELKECNEETVGTQASKLILTMEFDFVRDPEGFKWLGDWYRVLF